MGSDIPELYDETPMTPAELREYTWKVTPVFPFDKRNGNPPSEPRPTLYSPRIVNSVEIVEFNDVVME